MIATQIGKTVRSIVAGSSVALLLTLLTYHLHFNLSSAISIHLFLVVVIALRWGFLEASVVSVLSVVCLDYFFTQPVFAFYMSDAHDWVALLTFEATALLVSRLSNESRRHAQESATHEKRLQKLYELSQHVLVIDRVGVVEQQLVDLICSQFQFEGVALWNERELRLCKSGLCHLSDDEIRSAFYTGTKSDDPDRGISCRVLCSGARTIGSLVFCGHSLDSASMNAIASLAAVAIERARSFATEANAEAARQSEQLRSAILDGLAHAFKSPLTAIRVSSSGLLAMNTLFGVEERLVGIIDQKAAQLTDLTNHLLLTARLDRANLKLTRENVAIAEVVESSVAACMEEHGRSHTIDSPAGYGDSCVYADRKLLQMALVLMLDNAVKYSTPGSTVVIGVSKEMPEVTLTIHNQGSFIPFDERDKVFQRFYRCLGSSGAVSGTGIGLSVVKRIAEAHQGRAWVESHLASGTTFSITLPIKERKG
jgi:two-component system sensor histidine kinase KdpD